MAVQTAGARPESPDWRVRIAAWWPALRLYSGLYLFFFVLCHFLNHAAGLVSLQAMDATRPFFLAPFHNFVGVWLLVAAFTYHIGHGLVSVYRRTSYRMTVWEGAQIGLGLSAVGHALSLLGLALVPGIDGHDGPGRGSWQRCHWSLMAAACSPVRPESH